MSRSYRKFLSFEWPEFDPFSWPKFRIQERWCIREVRLGGEDVVFPRHFRSSPSSWWCPDHRHFKSKKSIRNGYFKEIQGILNSHTWSGYYKELFLECFNRIKCVLPSDGRRFRLEWLNSREAKAIISTWTGEPLDVLYYLTRARVIEKAVNLECKRCNRK